MSLTIEPMAEMLNSLQQKQKDERAIENEAIKNGLSESIKTEVTKQLVEGLQPIEDRQSKLESEVSDLKKIVTKLQSEKKNIIPNILTNPIPIENNIPRQTNILPDNKELKDLINLAKCTLTFSPITKDSLNLIREANHNVENTCELAVKRFLCTDLKMPESLVTNLKIIDAWPTTDLNDETMSWTKISARFEYPYIVSQIYNYVKNLQKGKRISMFIPKPF